ncbi:hypothetical protein O6P43_001532 [Quillaja saponaria]|uniref:Uncharacterized protein n=1 Tax=Quillaja saponaria TaxID=32244 RepID=A0AAD7VNK2_QUISA|nr:hypothetical protein O6P43_001532 [Quillaja saponaria]
MINTSKECLRGREFENGSVFQLRIYSGTGGSSRIYGGASVNVATATSAAVVAFILSCWNHGGPYVLGIFTLRRSCERRRLIGRLTRDSEISDQFSDRVHLYLVGLLGF